MPPCATVTANRLLFAEEPRRHSSINVSSGVSFDAMLCRAPQINKGQGKHARSSTFSTLLSGRFYRNSTLEAHESRKRRAARMQTKKQSLEKAVLFEERRLKLLREELQERRRIHKELRACRTRSAVTIQGFIRSQLSRIRAKARRRQIWAAGSIAIFCQTQHRGFRGREEALLRKDNLVLMKKKAIACIRIQCMGRGWKARQILSGRKIKQRKREYSKSIFLQVEEILGQYKSKCIHILIEERVRQKNRKEAAATLLQSMVRRELAQSYAEVKRKRLAKERAAETNKPKRTPLHMRRYSTYSISKSIPPTSKYQQHSNLRDRSSAKSIFRQTCQRRASCPETSLPLSSTHPRGSHQVHCLLTSNRRENRDSISKPILSKASSSDDRDDSSSISTKSACSRSTSNAMLREARQRAAARIADRKRQRQRHEIKEETVMLTNQDQVARLEKKRKQLRPKARNGAVVGKERINTRKATHAGEQDNNKDKLPPLAQVPKGVCRSLEATTALEPNKSPFFYGFDLLFENVRPEEEDDLG